MASARMHAQPLLTHLIFDFAHGVDHLLKSATAGLHCRHPGHRHGERQAKRVGRVYRVDPADIQPERHTMPGTSTQTGARIITSPIARLILRGSSRTTQTPRRPAGES